MNINHKTTNKWNIKENCYISSLKISINLINTKLLFKNNRLFVLTSCFSPFLSLPFMALKNPFWYGRESRSRNDKQHEPGRRWEEGRSIASCSAAVTELITLFPVAVSLALETPVREGRAITWIREEIKPNKSYLSIQHILKGELGLVFLYWRVSLM